MKNAFLLFAISKLIFNFDKESAFLNLKRKSSIRTVLTIENRV